MLFRSSLLFCAALSVHFTSAHAQDARVRFDGHSIVRAEINSLRSLRTMLALSPDCWSESTGFGTLDFRIPPDRMPALQKSNVDFKVLIEDVQVLLDAEQARLEAAEGGIAGGGFFTEYHRTNEIFAHYDELMTARPDLVSMEVIGFSIEGREIRRYTIGAGDPAVTPAIYITALAHAREWISPATVSYVVDQFVNLHGSNERITRILDNITWHVVAVSNPDGYEYTWDENRLWRKNRRNNLDGTYGVDWNRNFSAGWGGPGSSSNTNSETYRGTSAFSEPETIAIRDDITSLGNVLMFFDVHSYSQLMLWPYGYEESEPEGEAGELHRTIGEGVTDAIASVYGTAFTPQPAYDLYLASGTSLDWGWDAAGAYAFTYELRDTGAFGFILPPEQIIPSGEEILESFLYVGDQVLGDLTLEWIVQPNTTVEPGVEAELQARLTSVFGQLDETTATLATRINGSDIQREPMTPIGSDSFSSALPSGSCDDIIEYWLEIETLSGTLLTADNNGESFVTTVTELNIAFQDDAESNNGWTLGLPGDTATTGIWVRVDPNGTAAQPEDDATPGDGTMCFVTGQGSVGGGLGENDVDGGITSLLSPLFDLTGIDSPMIAMSVWYSNNQGANPNTDSMPIEISNNAGASWVLLEDVDTNAGEWVRREYDVTAALTPTSQMQLRFVARDLGDGSLVEAAIDDFLAFGASCTQEPCIGDLNNDGLIDGADLGLLLIGWETDAADLNGDGNTNGADLGLMLAGWGPC